MAPLHPTVGGIGAECNLRIRQGATFRKTITLFNPDGVTPIDLTGATFAAQMRRKALDVDAIVSFTCNVLDAANGKFELVLTDAQTSGIPAGEDIKDSVSNYVWDLEMHEAGGDVRPLLWGKVSVFREVTR